MRTNTTLSLGFFLKESHSGALGWLCQACCQQGWSVVAVQCAGRGEFYIFLCWQHPQEERSQRNSFFSTGRQTTHGRWSTKRYHFHLWPFHRQCTGEEICCESYFTYAGYKQSPRYCSLFVSKLALGKTLCLSECVYVSVCMYLCVYIYKYINGE